MCHLPEKGFTFLRIIFPDASTSLEKTSLVVLMANNSEYFMNAYEEGM